MFRNLILRFAKDFMVATTLNFTPWIMFIIIVLFSGLIFFPPISSFFQSVESNSVLEWAWWFCLQMVAYEGGFYVRQQFWLQRRNETSETRPLVSPTIRSDHSKTDACQEGRFWNAGLFGKPLKHLLDCTVCRLWFQRAALVSHTAFMYPVILPVVQRDDLIWNP